MIKKLVGPRWKGFTERQKPEWIMNFITNPDPIIDKYPALQAQRELFLVRTPNQALINIDAKNLLESTSEQKISKAIAKILKNKSNKQNH